MRVENWGLVPYVTATQKQLERVSTFSEDLLIFCHHPSVVTKGRGTQPQDIFGWTGEVVETSRGGRATYHGPQQIVGYPIIDLSKENRKYVGVRDLHSYMRALEDSLVKAINKFGVGAEARTVKVDSASPSLTGVWVGSKKIASIGIAVKRWISYHGFSLNLNYDPLANKGINPCGFNSTIMTSLEEVLGRKISREEMESAIANELFDILICS